VSVLNRKRQDIVETISVRARLVPIAKNASPMAKNAGRAAKYRADSFVARAMPRVDSARVWAAPRVERTGITVRDTVAPKVSDVLVATARRLEKSEPKRRRWPRRVATVAVLAAVGSAVAALAVRRRTYSPDFGPVSPVPDSTGLGSTATTPETADGEQAAAEAEVNGQHRMP
jgi:hypothetical protein